MKIGVFGIFFFFDERFLGRHSQQLAVIETALCVWSCTWRKKAKSINYMQKLGQVTFTPQSLHLIQNSPVHERNRELPKIIISNPWLG